jgi:hypothetical protein
MTLWQQPISLEALTGFNANCAVSHLGIEFVAVGEDFISARVPVDQRTKQPFGLLHGGVSVVLAETLGSCAANFACPPGLGHWHHPTGAYWPHHPGLADRTAQRCRRIDLRLAHHDGDTGTAPRVKLVWHIILKTPWPDSLWQGLGSVQLFWSLHVS